MPANTIKAKIVFSNARGYDGASLATGSTAMVK
jgi:hypothetical protein